MCRYFFYRETIFYRETLCIPCETLCTYYFYHETLFTFYFPNINLCTFYTIALRSKSPKHKINGYSTYRNKTHIKHSQRR